jgi:pyruvate-formate lyase-activating enzyme
VKILKIRYKTLEHERFEDSPFVGCLISAIDCKFNCKNCFNQPLKNLPTILKEEAEIIEEVKSNQFNKGIIFAGLEWTLQMTELVRLARLAKQNGLQTMLYTGLSFLSDRDIIKHFDYIKCGRYEEEKKTEDNIEYGVKLASSNQKIYKKGVDY